MNIYAINEKHIQALKDILEVVKVELLVPSTKEDKDLAVQMVLKGEELVAAIEKENQIK